MRSPKPEDVLIEAVDFRSPESTVNRLTAYRAAISARLEFWRLEARKLGLAKSHRVETFVIPGLTSWGIYLCPIPDANPSALMLELMRRLHLRETGQQRV